MPLENGTNPKVPASAGGAAIAGAVTVIVVYLVSLVGVDIPAEVAGALTVLIAAVGAFAGGWLKTDTRDTRNHV